tara:strand:- start:32 stop:349 length:318 start_codon:yes stop_codon:yes gene_type:complete
MKINMIITTTDSKDVVNNITTKILQNNYSPCIKIIPKILSKYKWNNKIVESDEILILIKSTNKNVNKCKEIIINNHNYEIPEIICGNYDILNENYKNWFSDNSVT